MSLSFLGAISGSNDPQASANATLVASLNGVQYNNTRVCGNAPAIGGPFSCPSIVVPIGFNFTFGVPFELSVALNAVAGGGLGGASISGGTNFGYSLPNGGTLSMVPEPSAVWLVPCASIALFFTRRRLRYTWNA